MNHSISFFRIIFTFIIAFWHFPILSKEWLHSGYIVVEFFFILSGFLLYRSSHKNIGTIQYTKERINKFYFKAVAITTIILFIDVSIPNNSINELLQYSVNIFCLLYYILPFENNIIISNGVFWYLTTLIWGSALIYAIIKTFPQKHRFILAYLSFACYAIILINVQNLNETLDKYPMPLLRAIGGLSLGCILNCIVNKHSNIIDNKLLNIISILGVIISTVLLFITGAHGILPIICYFFIIFACFKTDTIIYKTLNYPIFSKGASVCFEIFIGHLLVLKGTFKILQLCFDADITQGINTNEKIIGSIIYIISLWIFGYIYHKMCNKIEKRLSYLI